MPSPNQRSRPRGAAPKSMAGGPDTTQNTTVLRFDTDSGWVRPWPYSFRPEDIEPFVGPDGRDAFDGRQLRDPSWDRRSRRQQARAALRYLDKLLADDETDVVAACDRAADVFADLAQGAEVTL